MEQSSSIFNFRTLRTPVIIVSMYMLLEIVFRIYNFGAYTAVNWYKYNPQGILLKDMAMPVDDPNISWKLRPNAHGLLKTKPFNTNSLGFRNTEFAVNPGEGSQRIICLGRSITMGSGVSDDETYTHLLQKYFDDWKPDSVEVLNCGVGGYSFKQMLDYYESYVAPLNPDIVLIPMSPRDMARGDYRTPPPLSAAKTSLTNLKYYLSFTFSYNVMKTIVKRFAENVIAVDWNERVADIGKAKTEPTSSEGLLAEFIKRRSSEGVRCYFFAPDRRGEKQGYDTSEIETFLSQFEDADFLSINDYMDQRIPDKKYIYFPDTHPSAEMHAILAGALFQELKVKVDRN